MTNVVVVDVKGIVTQSGLDVLSRHADYGVALRRISPNSRLIILSKKNTHDHNLKQDMELVCTNSLFEFFTEGRQLLQKMDGDTLLVSGDPWESFLACKILLKLSNMKFPIQVQLHADVSSQNWRHLNWRNRVRSFLLKPAIRQAAQLRLVSNTQLENLERMLPGVTRKAVVIPVPIKIDPNWRESRKSQNICSIAIVGRIHKDRGLEEFLRVCKVLSERYKTLRIQIVGHGPHELWLKKSLNESGLSDSAIFYGYKDQQELWSMWQKFGCVASFAPSEAFGRSAREALIYGVPVLAMNSSGLIELGKTLGGKGFWLLDGLSDDQIRDTFGLASNFIVDIKISEALVGEVNTLNEKLAKSWILGAMLHVPGKK